MIAITLMYIALPILFTLLVWGCDRHKKLALVSLIPVIILAGLIVYFLLPSRNLLSIIEGNGWYSLLWLIIYETVKATRFDDDSTKYDVIMNMATAVVFLCGIVGVCHTHMSVKPTWDSISKTYSKSSEAPTFKRGETPIALAPGTVLNRVRKASSDVPNTQYYSISDNVQAQYYRGKPVYVIPIEYNGFWTMQKAQEIPGYFIIDATKQGATPKFVKKPYKYATSAYFGKDAERQIYRHMPNWLSLGSPQLEIDDNGTPYWVETLYKPEALSHRVNWSRLQIVVMNAQTGSVKSYSTDKLPKFIDEGITSSIANNINRDFGKYRYGFWNAHFSKTGVMKPTGNGVEDGVTSVFNKNDTISYFTDFTTDKTGSDSALGYSMINARTGHLTFYKANNIMDSDGAKNNAEQDYKAQRWHPTMPILYNVNGHPTWVMTITDSTHAIRGYYYLDATDQSVYGTGTSPISALDSFRQALANNGSTAGNTPGQKAKRITGLVDRVAILSSQNKVLFTMKRDHKTVFTINLSDYSSAALMRPNDKIKFSANVVNGKSIGNVSSWQDYNLK